MKIDFGSQKLTIIGGLAATAIVGLLLVTPPPAESIAAVAAPTSDYQMDTLIYSTIAQRTYNPTPTALPLSRAYTAAEISEAAGRHSINQRYCCKVAENGGEPLDWTREKQAWDWLKISAKYHYRNAEYEWNRRDKHIANIEKKINGWLDR